MRKTLQVAMNKAPEIKESMTAHSDIRVNTGLINGAKSAAKNLRFLFIAPVVKETFYELVKRGMNDAAAAMNVDVSFTGTLGVDLEEQARMIEQAASAGYDGIAANLIDPHRFDEVVKQTVAWGVPVIAFNTDAGKHNARLSAVGQNSLEAGKVLGVHVAHLVDHGDAVLITMHDRGVYSLEQRCAGISEQLTSKGIRWKVDVAHSTPQGSAEAISKMLKQDASLKFVCATGLADTEGAGLVIEQEYGHRGYGVAGFDLSTEILRLIDSDIIKVTIDQCPYLQGFYPVVQLALYCRYGLRPCDIDTGAEIITKNDLKKNTEISEHWIR